MGYHWYAVSRELAEVERALDDVERRFTLEAGEAAIDAASAEREVLFVREDAARVAMEQRGESVTIAAARAWPADVQPHLGALGAPSNEEGSLLGLLDWGRNYYVENLDHAGVPMRRFSRDLRAVVLEPAQGRELAEELLRYASSARKPQAARAARVAGLWLWLWASLDCRVEAGT